jgi:hypothetical protein
VSEFKKGDKVVCIKASDWDEGDEGIVKSQNVDLVTVVLDSGKTVHMYPRRFEKVVYGCRDQLDPTPVEQGTALHKIAETVLDNGYHIEYLKPGRWSGNRFGSPYFGGKMSDHLAQMDYAAVEQRMAEWMALRINPPLMFDGFLTTPFTYSPAEEETPLPPHVEAAKVGDDIVVTLRGKVTGNEFGTVELTTPLGNVFDFDGDDLKEACVKITPQLKHDFKVGDYVGYNSCGSSEGTITSIQPNGEARVKIEASVSSSVIGMNHGTNVKYLVKRERPRRRSWLCPSPNSCRATGSATEAKAATRWSIAGVWSRK